MHKIEYQFWRKQLIKFAQVAVAVREAALCCWNHICELYAGCFWRWSIKWLDIIYQYESSITVIILVFSKKKSTQLSHSLTKHTTVTLGLNIFFLGSIGDQVWQFSLFTYLFKRISISLLQNTPFKVWNISMTLCQKLFHKLW